MKRQICAGSRMASTNEFTEDRRVKCHICGKIVPITGYSAMFKHRIPNSDNKIKEPTQ